MSIENTFMNLMKDFSVYVSNKLQDRCFVVFRQGSVVLIVFMILSFKLVSPERAF